MNKLKNKENSLSLRSCSDYSVEGNVEEVTAEEHSEVNGVSSRNRTQTDGDSRGHFRNPKDHTEVWGGFC